MPILTGKDGTVFKGGTPLVPLAAWRLALKCESYAYAANDSGGALRRLAGSMDCAGTLRFALVEGGACPLAPGQSVELELHVDATGENYYELPAVIERVELVVELSSGAPLAYEAAFAADGPLAAHGILQTT